MKKKYLQQAELQAYRYGDDIMGWRNRVAEATSTQLTNLGQRIYPQQKSQATRSDLINMLNGVGQTSQFQNLNEFFKDYRTNYARIAYDSMTPAACHQLAMANPWVSAAIYAIVKPIASSKLIAMPVDKDDPNLVAEAYMNLLMSNPNQIHNSYTFKQQIGEDLEQTGQAFIEVAYHPRYDIPAALYRVAPYKIEPQKFTDGSVRYVRKDTGYVFEDQEIVPILNPNPFEDYKGLSKLVALHSMLMMDAGLTEHNARFFINDVLKGIISLSDKIDPVAIDKEIERAKVEIKKMKASGEAGHLMMYGATFQPLSMNNRDMLTDKVQQSVLDAVCAVYRVPPHKIMKIESGNLGGGTGESQDESMNETLLDEANLILAALNDKFLIDCCGITDTVYGFVNLTRTDEKRQQEIQRMRLEDGILSIDEERIRLGLDPWELEYTQEPTVQANRIPISKAGDLTFMSGNTPSPKETNQEPSSADNPKERDQRIINAVKRWDERFESIIKEF